jgi:uncharacterized protein (DUF1330 family)
MQQYGEKVPETLAAFNHRYVVRSSKTQSLEGEPPAGIVVIAFDSVAKAREWYDSPAYAAIRPKQRLWVADSRIAIQFRFEKRNRNRFKFSKARGDRPATVFGQATSAFLKIVRSLSRSFGEACLFGDFAP